MIGSMKLLQKFHCYVIDPKCSASCGIDRHLAQQRGVICGAK